jgi:hypothetical protein
MLRPYIFFSKKNTPAEYNYKIYDKKMLTIIRALRINTKLKNVSFFRIRTDHKNLEYFIEIRKLTKR